MLFHANSSNLVDSPLHFAKKQTTKTYNFKNDVNMYLPLYRNHNRYRRLSFTTTTIDGNHVETIKGTRTLTISGNNTLTNNPIRNITSKVSIIPRPGIFIPSCSRKGDAKSPRNLNKILTTQ